MLFYYLQGTEITFFTNYDTKVEKDTLINEDDAHKVVFCTFSDLLEIFYMWSTHMNLQVRYHKTHSHSSHLNWVRDSQNSDFDVNTIANEDGQHFYANNHIWQCLHEV